MGAPRTFSDLDERLLLFRCTHCGRVKMLSEMHPTQREKLERGANVVRCTACIEGRGKPLPGYVGGCKADSTMAEAFPVPAQDLPLL